MITKKEVWQEYYKLKAKRVKFKRYNITRKRKFVYNNCKHFGIDDLPF
jgi:hypothetical protein